MDDPDDRDNHSQARTPAQAGTLPSASRPTIRQSTRRLKPDEAVAASFVVAENTRSVPTATAGDWPKQSTSSGVINEPPPTPVKPMSRPTNPPHKTKRRGCGFMQQNIIASRPALVLCLRGISLCASRIAVAAGA